jgi:Flp pilus assembly protein TadG
MESPTKRKYRRRAAAAVETAMVLSAFLLFVFGIYEYGRLLFMKELLDNAAREGARYAVVNTANVDSAAIQTEVRSFLANQQTALQNLQIDVYLSDANGNNIGAWTDAQFGEYIMVQVTGTYKPILPSLFFMKASINLRGQSLMYAETN